MLETDYLIVGSGAVGMAFADVLLTETDATLTIVDRYAKPGGHWNVAYPFVNLHQPSLYYGVSSKKLENGEKDAVGLNKGLHSLASGAQVCAYFDEVMQHQFLPSGRVQYFPLCEYTGNYQFTSKLTGKTFEVKVNKKLVDCTFLNTSVPSTHTPNFTIDPDVQFMPINDLPTIQTAPAGFVIIGGGKTGIDACLWLLENGVDPDAITWIVSRDGWLTDRQNVQPTAEFFEYAMGAQANQLEAVAKATSIEDMFDRLEAAGILLRLDKNVRPTMFHGATISQLELAELRRLKHVIRMGRVQRIEADQIILDKGTIPTSPAHIHIDCSATPFTDVTPRPIFQGDVIIPQTVRPYQPIFSAAFIAHIEASYEKEDQKNEICNPVLLPNHDTDWIHTLVGQLENQAIWSKYKELRNWLYHNRLDGFRKLVKDTPKDDLEKAAILKKMRQYAVPALLKAQSFLQELEPTKGEGLTHPQFQIRKNIFFKGRLVDTPKEALAIEEGEVLVKIDSFAFTSNNITYAVAGDMLGYWKFFPAAGKDAAGWGVLPVWGFADVVESNVPNIPVGDRFFGYFPPASHLKMRPSAISDQQFIEASAHRVKLPQGYNLYRRVKAEPGYSSSMDHLRSLLFPLYLTSYCIWDSLQEQAWHEAKQVLVLSASSKTSIGFAYAMQADEHRPQLIGMTSARNLETVQGLSLYDHCLDYTSISALDPTIPTLIVDMSGNQPLIAALHQHLGDNMRYTLNVGITHWMNAQRPSGINSQRSGQFFAPGHAQKRIKEWGAKAFNQKINAFVMTTAAKTSTWLTVRKLDGLEAMANIHQAVCQGEIPANEGLIVVM